MRKISAGIREAEPLSPGEKSILLYAIIMACLSAAAASAVERGVIIVHQVLRRRKVMAEMTIAASYSYVKI